MTRAVHRPVRIGSVASLTAGIVAVALVATGGGQFRALAVEVVGLLTFALGVELHRREGGFDGVVIAGAGVVGVALALGSAGSAAVADQMVLVPGMVGLSLLTAGLAGTRDGWDRHLVTAGSATILVGVVASGIVMGSSSTVLLAAVTATVVAWDVGEQAINLGEQVGRRATTYSVELVHAAGSLAVGGVGMTLALGVRSGDVTGLPLVGLALLLVAGVTLTLALYN